jgi:hypothetical protein
MVAIGVGAVALVVAIIGIFLNRPQKTGNIESPADDDEHPIFAANTAQVITLVGTDSEEKRMYEAKAGPWTTNQLFSSFEVKKPANGLLNLYATWWINTADSALAMLTRLEINILRVKDDQDKIATEPKFTMVLLHTFKDAAKHEGTSHSQILPHLPAGKYEMRVKTFGSNAIRTAGADGWQYPGHFKSDAYDWIKGSLLLLGE